jgi:hypothetical protein
VSEDQKFKADGGKSDPTLLEVGCIDALDVVNAVLDYGAQKYEPNSWKGVSPTRYDKAARRHRKARDKGLLTDNESGLLHLAHEVINNLFLLQQYIEAHPGYDFLTFNKPPQDHKLTTAEVTSPTIDPSENVHDLTYWYDAGIPHIGWSYDEMKFRIVGGRLYKRR